MEVNVIFPVFAAVSVVCLIIGKVYYKVRTKFSIKVNCWFCNSNTSVPYNSSNSWYCPHCEQYNGFWPDGSYNRLLQDQFNEKLNCGSWCTKIREKRLNTNGLCQFCNINLELKIHQLAQFVPFNNENYDEEVQQYSNQLERVYRLCSRCQVILDKTLKYKYKTYVSDQLHSSNSTFDVPIYQVKLKERHPAYVCLTTMLAVTLLLSAVPSEWNIIPKYQLPDYVLQLMTFVQKYLPDDLQYSIFLGVGVIAHVLDCAFIRDNISFVSLLLWVIVFTLTHVPLQFDSYVPSIVLVASIVLFIISVGEFRRHKTKSIAAVKPVQIKKMDVKTNYTKKSSCSAEKERISPVDKAKPSNYSVSDPKHPQPPPSPVHEPTPEDFGFSKLNVSSRRITRSQTKHFPTKIFRSQSADLFKPRSLNLSPPKLQLDKSLDYQAPLTRASSSQSSGFVSLSHQKYLDESRSPSVVAEDLDSISQCRENTLIAYSPPSLSTPFPMHYSQFPSPYAVMHFMPNGFNTYYQYSQMSSNESPWNLSTVGMQHSATKGYFQIFKDILFSSAFLFLLTSNIAILWKVFGQDYLIANT